MTTLREAAQRALAALDKSLYMNDYCGLEVSKHNQPDVTNAIENLRAALAEPVQEPQGCAHCNHPLYAATKCRVCGRVTEPTPPQRKPLSEEELSKIIDTQIGFNSCVGWEEDFARAVERAHGIGGKE